MKEKKAGQSIWKTWYAFSQIDTGSIYTSVDSGYFAQWSYGLSFILIVLDSNSSWLPLSGLSMSYVSFFFSYKKNLYKDYGIENLSIIGFDHKAIFYSRISGTIIKFTVIKLNRLDLRLVGSCLNIRPWLRQAWD